MAELSRDYAEVTPMFRHLTTLSRDSAEFRSQRDTIIQRCLPLADHIARRFKNRGEPQEDLIQVARLGLVNAVNRYDVESGSEFLSFAVPTIMGEVRRHFRDHGWAVKVPRGLKDLNMHINASSAELSHSLGRAPTATELANHLEVNREQVMEALIASCAYSTSSTDKPAQAEDDRRAPLDIMGGIDTNFDKVLDIQTVRPLIAALPEQQRTVLLLRFFHNMTQSQIAQRLGVSQMQVSRILMRAITTVRDQAQPHEAAASQRNGTMMHQPGVTRTAPKESVKAPLRSVDDSRCVARMGAPERVDQRENVA
jgi:RNA polymerase sigma-B factor